MGESANLAFYAVVFAKGTVPRARLDEALNRAVGTGAPLEAVLVQTGALSRADCDGLLKIREQLGRGCQSCDGTTYLLQDQTEANKACDYCGGRLLSREQQRAREAARAARPAEPPRRGAPPAPARRTSERTPPVSPRPGAAPAPGPGARPPGQPAPRQGPPLEARLAQLEQQLGALTRALSDERDARAAMNLLVNEAAASSARIDELAARLEAGLSEVAATRAAAQAGPAEAAERALLAVQERLGVEDVGLLPGRIAEQVAPRVLQAVRDRLGLDELAELPARVAAEALARVTAGAGAIDEEALARRVAALLAPAASGAEPPAGDELLEQAAAEAARRALEAVEARLAAQALPAARGDDELLERAAAEAARRALEAVEARLADARALAAPQAPDPREEAALVERVLEALEGRHPGADPEVLAERVTRQALDAVAERLDRQPDPREALQQAVQGAQADVAARAREAARALLDEQADEREAAARTLVQEAARGVEDRVAAVAAAAYRSASDEVAGQVARAVEDSLLSRLDERLDARLDARLTQHTTSSGAELTRAVGEAVGEAEARIARATSEVLEALSVRVEEVAAAAAQAEGAATTRAEAAARAALEQLDDPRELLQRATAQAVRSFSSTLDERLAALRADVLEAALVEAQRVAPAPAPALEPAAPAAPGASPEALRALEARVSLIAGELKDALETLDARIAALRERMANRPKEGRVDAELVARAVNEAGAALEARLSTLEARPAGAAPPADDDAPDAQAVVQRAVQAVWDQLAPLDLPGLSGRVGEQVLAAVTARLDKDLAGLSDTIAQEATAPVLRSIEARLKKLDLDGLPGRVTRDVIAQARQTLVDDEALTETLAQKVAEQVGGRRGGPRPAEDEAALAPEVETLVDRAAARALEWVEDRLTALERGGGVELEMARAAARTVAAEVVEQRLRDLPAPSAAGPRPEDFDGAKTIVADPSKSGAFDARAGEPRSGVFERKFVALAREVKNLKDTLEELQPGGGGAAAAAARSGGATPQLVALLASAEFKQAFDVKVKEVLNYIKGDLVPSAVKKALQQGSGTNP